MKRREILKTGVAAAALPMWGAAQSGASATSWRPAVFNDQQNETVILVTELIIPATDTPGAKEALVNRYIDLFLKEGPETERERFLTGLAALDGVAQKEYDGAFAKLSPSQQTALLSKLDTQDEESGEAPRFFRMIKSMTARIYYQTSAGYRELNKDGVPRGFGCTHPKHKQ